jgi:lipopolysaccharide export system permease protein
MQALPGTLDRMLLRELLRLFTATLGGVVLLYLVIDFADRGSIYRGRAWASVAELYANKAAVVGHQLAPAALIIAAALLVAWLGRRGELTGLFSVGCSPLRLCAPIALFAAGLSGALVWMQERVVVFADARAEEITATRFNRWGDWAVWHAESSWVRGREGRIFRLGTPVGLGFEPASVLEVDAKFRLLRRLDAKRLEFAGPGEWRLSEVVERRYAGAPPPSGAGAAGGSILELTSPSLLQPFPDTLEELSLRNGRPRQLPWGALREQAARRERLGQPVREYQITLAERAFAPLLLVPAALAAVGLLLRRTRRNGGRGLPLSAALALGLGLSLALWALTVVLHAAAVGGALPPWLAGAVPSVCCAALAAAVLWPARAVA